jgi:nitrogen regulatory protein P-II 1
MKILTLIVHDETREALADVLRALPQVAVFTFTHVEGHGTRDTTDPLLSARDRVIGYVPHARVDIVLEDENVETVIETLRRSGCGVAGRCLHWVTAVTNYGPL